MPRTSYVTEMTAEQIEKLQHCLEEKQWELDEQQHAVFRARKNKTTCVAYKSGKIVVQGKGTEELVQFTIEPEILHEARFGYELYHAKNEDPDMFQPHAGMDESGKGDFLGPMVVACCYVDETTAERLFDEGVQDSKNIKSDKQILRLNDVIREAVGRRFAIVRLGNPAYNRMHKSMRNVNRILAWAHARALEDLLEKVPQCPRALCDQFGHKSIVERALREEGRRIQLDQRPKAEADVAVAAASILARAEFVDQMQKLAEKYGLDAPLPRGASSRVIDIAAGIVRKQGEGILNDIAKTHFRTTAKVLAAAGRRCGESGYGG